MTAAPRLTAWSTIARFVAGLAIIAAFVWGPSLYGKLTSDARLAAGLEASGAGPVNVRIEMSFRPKTFQREQLSKYGVFGGIRGNSVVLFNLSRHNLGRVADLYWVDGIKPLRSD
jgi:hypothetical protein